MNNTRLPHELDDDACCVHCGYDGAEVHHQVKLGVYERTDSDRWCEERERKARADMRRWTRR